MSAKKFIQLLEDNGVLDAATLREIRRQVKDKNVSAATVAKALVEKGKLTKFQATKLVGQATAAPEPGDDDESGLLLVEETPEDNEVVLLESAADEPEEVVGLTPVEDAGAALTPVGGVPASGSGGLELLDGGLEPIGGGGLDAGPEPTFFIKPTSSLSGPNDPVVIPPGAAATADIHGHLLITTGVKP